ncbi:MAG: hypothetical protein IKA62_07925 [Clostridia bacterium]|nr:hypothetical protein [Clostridia bacterium]
MKDIIYKNNRPLKIVHSYYNDDNLTLDEKKAKVTETIERLYRLNFGGIVTNVRWNFNTNPAVPVEPRNGYYTKDSEEWEVFRFALSEIKRLGLRAWVYDEHGYPSGGAGGLTLAANPEYECRAIAEIPNILHPGEKITVTLPHGHKCFIYGASYICNDKGEPTDFTPVEEFIDDGCDQNAITFNNHTDKLLITVAFADKYLYEGTHAEHNAYECRRYIDVMNRDAVREFIRNTYEVYTEYSKDHYTDGDGLVEAYFTDEPSLMGRYINEGFYPRVTRDSYDDSIPLYRIANYGRDVRNVFESLSGMPFEQNLIYLFYGNTQKAKRVRYFFHLTTSTLFEKSFYEQISNYCKLAGTRFSGHILLEDDIRHHVLFEGNYFSLLRHMHFPGIDMLISIPETVYKYAFTPKLISSIAHAYNRPHVMSEVSAHNHGGRVTPAQMYAAIALQYAFGVDIFTSYYSVDLCDTETYQKYNSAIGNIGDFMGNGRHVADVLLYYPIETFMMNQIPRMKATYTSPENYSEPENICHDGLYSTIKELCDSQIDFDLADLELIKDLEIKDGCLIGRQGEKYSYLVLPPMELTADAYAYLDYLSRRGIKIYALKSTCFEDLNNADFCEKFDSSEALVAAFERCTNRFAVSEAARHDGIACLCRDFDGKYRYMLVNSRNKKLDVTLTLKNLANTRLISPVDMSERTVLVEKCTDGVKMTFTINEYETLLID